MIAKDKWWHEDPEDVVFAALEAYVGNDVADIVLAAYVDDIRRAEREEIAANLTQNLPD